MENAQLIYIASSSKGDHLFDALRSRYLHSIYIDSGYKSIKRLDRILKQLLTFNRSFSRCIRNPANDLWFRRKIEERTMEMVRKAHEKQRMESDVLFWFPYFPITSEWKKYGRLGAITDVAMDDHYFQNFDIPMGKAREFRKNNWNQNFDNCDYVFTLSRWALESNKKLHPDQAFKIRSIGWGPNIIPLASNEVFSAAKEDRILCVGHDYYKKGADIFNEVSRRLKRVVPNLECIMVGRAGTKLDLSTLDSLTIYPAASPDWISTIMKSSKLFMILSRFEAAGHVTVEAMSHGLPVICSNVCGLPEPIVNGETGYVVDIKEIDDIVAKSYELLTNQEKLEMFSKTAYENAMQKWQWNHVAEAITNASLS